VRKTSSFASVLLLALAAAPLAAAENPMMAKAAALYESAVVHAPAGTAPFTFDKKGTPVPRKDATTLSITGTISDVLGFDYLDDGTPFALIQVTPHFPATQDILVGCIGNAAYTCYKAHIGKRAKLDGTILSATLLDPNDPDTPDPFWNLATMTKITGGT
jgi:hypothetical protein